MKQSLSTQGLFHFSFTTPDNSANYDLLFWDTTTNTLVAALTQNTTGSHTKTATFNLILGHQYVAMVGTPDSGVRAGNYSFCIYL